MSKLDRFNAEIAEKIRGGSYYKEAWDWYALKYIYPVSQRTLFIFITLAALLVMFSTAVILYNFYPLKTYVPVVVDIENKVLDYSRLQQLKVPEKTDPTLPVMEYMVRSYVEQLERYQFDEIDAQLKFLQQFSNPGLFAEISKRYDTFNLDSLILKYRDHTTRTVRITGYQLEMPEGFDLAKEKEKDIVTRNIPYRAMVDFETQETNLLGVTARRWQASLSFNMSPVVLEKATKSFLPLDFQVNSYTVRPLP